MNRRGLSGFDQLLWFLRPVLISEATILKCRLPGKNLREKRLHHPGWASACRTTHSGSRPERATEEVGLTERGKEHRRGPHRVPELDQKSCSLLPHAQCAHLGDGSHR